jgi:NADPH:quinone reductase
VLDELAHLITLGVYPPGTPRLFPLADGPNVLERLATGQTIGKVGLEPTR